MLILKGLIEAGVIKPVIDRVYPQEQIVEAHGYVEQGRKKGNVAIMMDFSMEMYVQTKHVPEVRALFQAAYPAWDVTQLDHMLYDEKHPSHIQTTLAYENGLILG